MSDHNDISPLERGYNTFRAGLDLVRGGGGRTNYTGFEGQYDERDIEIVPNMKNGGCPPGSRIAVDDCTGEIYCKKTRKRRKRLLSCSDKADIAFVVGTLGKGSLAQTAIASLIARCG